MCYASIIHVIEPVCSLSGVSFVVVLWLWCGVHMLALRWRGNLNRAFRTPHLRAKVVLLQKRLFIDS